MKRKLLENHEWKDFNQFKNSDEYLPPHGDGDNKGTQAATALCKLIYKWFNDGDVFDNQYNLKGWANDISGSANWLYAYIPGTEPILNRIKKISSDEEYTDLLFDLISYVDPMIPGLAKEEKIGDAYDEAGPFAYHEAQTCPECGEEVDDWEYNRYGMCEYCYQQQQEWEEEEEEYDDE